MTAPHVTWHWCTPLDMSVLPASPAAVPRVGHQRDPLYAWVFYVVVFRDSLM